MICKSINILKVYLIHYTLRSNPNVKKKTSDNKNVTKNVLFFIVSSNSQVLYELKHTIHLFQNCMGFSMFDSVSFLLKNFVFVAITFSTKSTDSLTLKRNNSFQNRNNRKGTHSFAPRPLIFKLELPKNWPGHAYNFLSL